MVALVDRAGAMWMEGVRWISGWRDSPLMSKHHLIQTLETTNLC